MSKNAMISYPKKILYTHPVLVLIQILAIDSYQSAFSAFCAVLFKSNFILPAAILLCFKGSPFIVFGAEISKNGLSVG